MMSMERVNLPSEVFVVEDAGGNAQRNSRTGTMFYTRVGHATKAARVGHSVIAFELVRKGPVSGPKEAK